MNIIKFHWLQICLLNIEVKIKNWIKCKVIIKFGMIVGNLLFYRFEMLSSEFSFVIYSKILKLQNLCENMSSTIRNDLYNAKINRKS